MYRIKKMAREVMTVCGINNIARNKTSQMPRIIMYHGFCKNGDKDLKRTPIDQFRKQLTYIKKHFLPLKVSELALEEKLNGSYPENAVAITIDDGYEDFYHLAWPVLREMDIPATVFVVTDLTEKNGWIWTDKFHFLVECLTGSCNELNSRVSKELLSNLKNLSINERDDQLNDLANKYNIFISPKPPYKYKLMLWDQLKVLKNSGLIEIGAHSCTHPIMKHLNNDDSWYEIYESKYMISERLKLEVSSFCYPNGQIGDYLEGQKEMLKQAGYLCGIASHFGYVAKSSDTYSLPRIVGGGRDFNLFAKSIDGVDYFQRKIFS